MLVYMRSNDVFLGLPHDVFCFTMLQEIIAASLGAKIGTYTHLAGSLHLYDDKRKAAEKFLGEGWQTTKVEMPAMPAGDPLPAIHTLVDVEKKIRVGDGAVLDIDLSELDAYWADIIRLLQIFKCLKVKSFRTLAEIRGRVKCATYLPYIDSKLPKG
jgi:thymidylate synthase